MGMGPRILSTKTHIPLWNANGVSRPRLLDALKDGFNKSSKFILVSAPAGYGKTTLIAEWYHSLPERAQAGWISLDESDNDLGRFLRYLLAVIQNEFPDLGGETQAWLDLPQLPPVDHWMDELINELAALPQPFLLTLDDYHVITNPVVHLAVGYFLDHLPEQCTLIMTTRADPPFPLARMRARGQMVELRASDLRFTLEEGRSFFGRVGAVKLSEEMLRALDERNEGWAAGLQLAALALQNQPNPAAYVEAFRGSHRYVLDYLAEEVIRQLDESTRAFLMQTSVLDRFNADVCVALTGQEDSQVVIARLEQANLFIVPLDAERRWYRYHNLFADYLRSLLTKAERKALCQKAADWHEINGFLSEAVHYALSGGDPDHAADVIDRTLAKETTWSQGDLAQWLTWLEGLPAHVYSGRPRLSLNASRVLYLLTRFEQAEALLAHTEEELQGAVLTPEAEQMLALVALYRGSIDSVRGNIEMAFERTDYALARIPQENHLAYARGFFTLGLSHELSDHLSQAVKFYQQSSSEARMAGVLFLEIHALCAAAQVQIRQGNLRLAEQSCRAAIQAAQGARLYPLGLAWSILGIIALERNDLVASEQYLQDGIALSRRGGLMDDVILGEAHLARVRVYQGKFDLAFAALHEIQVLFNSMGIKRMELQAESYLARLDLYVGKVESAAKRMEIYRAFRSEPLREFAELTFARVLLATGELDALPSILHPLLERALAAERLQSALEAMMLLGRYHQARREMSLAVDWLTKSLRLAAPEGYIRVYLDEGQALSDLLSRARGAAPDLVEAILRINQDDRGPQAETGEKLIDPLSPQEERVLKMIVAGKSNQEIADDLVISLGTAKWHVHNVLQKLGASNRPQAIARARSLGY